MSSAAKPLWKDYLFAGLRRTIRAAPLIGAVVDVVDEVRSRREAAARHDDVLESLSRVERNMLDLVRAEITASLAALREPCLSIPALDEEVRNLFEIRRQGFDTYMFEGLLANSSFLDQLKQRPSTFGRVLGDADKPRDDAFYVFLDADKTRLLEVTPFTLQQLLANQTRGVPEARLVGAADVFAEVAVPKPAGRTPPTKAAPARAGFSERLGAVFRGEIPPTDHPTAAAAPQGKPAVVVKGFFASMQEAYREQTKRAGALDPTSSIMHKLFRLHLVPETPADVFLKLGRSYAAGPTGDQFQVFGTPAGSDERYIRGPTPAGFVSVRFHAAIPGLKSKPFHKVPASDLIPS